MDDFPIQNKNVEFFTDFKAYRSYASAPKQPFRRRPDTKTKTLLKMQNMKNRVLMRKNSRVNDKLIDNSLCHRRCTPPHTFCSIVAFRDRIRPRPPTLSADSENRE